MIILKDVVTTALLSLVVLGDGAPSHNGLFVSPCGMRQDPPWSARAFEALVVDEPVDGFELRLELFGERQIVVALNYAADYYDEVQARVRANDAAWEEAERIEKARHSLLA